MAAKTAPHTCRTALTFKHAVEAVDCEMTFAWQDDTDALFSDPGGFATQLWNAAVAKLVPELCPEVVLNGVVFEDIRSVPYGGADFPQTPTHGTNGSGSVKVPTDTSIAIKRVTGAVGRSYRGRLYWPLWDGSYLVTADTTGAAYLNDVVAALESFQAAVEGGTYPCTCVLVSFYSDKALRDPGISTPITGWSYKDLVVDSQRRRLLGRGR
jgi:hypothetical protein